MHIVTDKFHGTRDKEGSRRFRTEVFDIDGDGDGDHIGLSEVKNFADGDDATTYTETVELQLDGD